MVGEQELDLAERGPLPPAEADQEGHRPGGGGQPGRLRVEADQRHVGRRLPGECRQPRAVDRQGTARRLAPDDHALGSADDLAIDRGSQPRGEVLDSHSLATLLGGGRVAAR